MNNQAPTLNEFLKACRNELVFLHDYGFIEVLPPNHRQGNDFQLWFNNDDRYIIITGEGRGEYASITLEHRDGLELAEIFLVPKEKRPLPYKKTKKQLSQLEQVHQSSTWLKEYCTDFLNNDLKRFYERAEPLPPYKHANF